MTLRGFILERLRLMNITRATLFPGLEGFAQSFQQLLVKETPEQQRARLGHRVLKEFLGGQGITFGGKVLGSAAKGDVKDAEQKPDEVM